jgi:type II secretory pathway component PulM
MSTKTSQKTEDMLDQTFANFDSEVTGAETQQTKGSSEPGSNSTKKSKNLMIFIGAGIIAVGGVAYFLVLKPQLEQKPVVRAAVKAPVAKAPAVDPVAQAQEQAKALEKAKTPVQEQAQALAQSMGQAQAPVVDPLQAQAPVVGVVNSQPVAVVEELKSMFDQQTNEFRMVLTDIDGRVTNLEGNIAEQKQINTKVDERLVALEKGKSKRTTSNSVVGNQVKRSVAKKATVVKKEDAVFKEANVLVDKASESQKTKIEENSLAQINLHSIYGGRIWVKNSDGSLSTFSAGDKLPTGETIKSIDDEKFEVKTNKRVIGK